MVVLGGLAPGWERRFWLRARVHAGPASSRIEEPSRVMNDWS
jgi:hypothetical protein